MKHLAGVIGLICMTAGFTYLLDAVSKVIRAWKETVKENKFFCEYADSCTKVKCGGRCKHYDDCKECTNEQHCALMENKNK